MDMKSNVWYTPVPIEVAMDNCWESCDDFEVDVSHVVVDGKVYWTVCSCRNLKKCLRIKELLQKEKENKNE